MRASRDLVGRGAATGGAGAALVAGGTIHTNGLVVSSQGTPGGSPTTTILGASW